jgi:hypothetical protein
MAALGRKIDPERPVIRWISVNRLIHLRFAESNDGEDANFVTSVALS